MTNAREIISTVFFVSHGKFALFLIIFMLISSFVLLISFDDKKERKTENGLIIELIEENHTSIAVILVVTSIFVFGVNYMVPQTSYTNYEAQIILGNSTQNISEIDIERLQTISKEFSIAKRSVQSTPSRWDIDNTDLSDNKEFWRSNKVTPSFDTHINSEGDWTWIHVELYYPDNGIGPIGTKHTHDYEYIQFYFYKNETTPRYITFPTTQGLTHPKELVEWDEIPKNGDIRCIALAAETNSFDENYENYPEINRNIRLSLVSPEINDAYDYLSAYEKVQFWVSLGSTVIIIIYINVTDKIRHWHFLILIITALSTVYPYTTLQYDFLTNFSFRVWQNGEHYDDINWYEDRESREYVETYSLPHDRERWTEPAFDLGKL